MPGRAAAAVLLLASVAALGVLGCDAAPSPSPSAAPSASASSAVATPAATPIADTRFDELAVGDCVADLPEVYVVAVARVACGEPHRLEVFAVFELPDDADYPGDRAVDAAAYAGCIARFSDYVGEEYFASDARYDVGHATPTLATWHDDGDRAVVCWVFPRDGSYVLGSVRAAR
jgi:hypothetical protein